MKGKICIVTGANAGIGKITARHLARKGATVLMLCRNAQKAEEAKAEIIKATANNHIEVFLVDFASQEQIYKVAEAIKQKYSSIDILVNNAGFIAGSQREITEDGLEKTFAVNHIGYFLLTHLLLENLKASPEARIVNVSSDAHRWVSKVNYDDLQFEKGYTSLKSYALSKLLNIHFTKGLAERLKDTNITVNCLHPGVVATNFAKESNGLFKILFTFGRAFMSSPEQGAATSIYLATSTEVDDITGEYFDNKKIRKPSSEATLPENIRKTWELSEKICKLNPSISL